MLLALLAVGVRPGDDFIAGAHAYREERQMKGGRAAGHRTGLRRTHEVGELPLKRCNLRTLRDPARQNCPSRGRNFFLPEMRSCHGNKFFRHV